MNTCTPIEVLGPASMPGNQPHSVMWARSGSPDGAGGVPRGARQPHDLCPTDICPAARVHTGMALASQRGLPGESRPRTHRRRRRRRNVPQDPSRIGHRTRARDGSSPSLAPATTAFVSLSLSLHVQSPWDASRYHHHHHATAAGAPSTRDRARRRRSTASAMSAPDRYCAVWGDALTNACCKWLAVFWTT